MVEINSPEMVPAVQPIVTGRYQWHRLEKTLLDEGINPSGMQIGTLLVGVSGRFSQPSRATGLHAG